MSPCSALQRRSPCSSPRSTRLFRRGQYLYHLLFSQQSTAATITSQATQTQAVITGTQARNAAQTAGAAQGVAMQGALGAKSVMSSAAQAFSGTYASVSQIPVIGRIMAPAAAGAAYAVVAAYEGVASLDVGAWNVPSDMPAQIRRGEMVVPRTFAEGMRQNASGASDGGGGGGDTHNWNIKANDAHSFKQMVSSPANRSSLAKAMRQHFRR